MKFDLSSINVNTIKKGINYIRSNGISGVWSRMRDKANGPGNAYNSWFKKYHSATETELAEQREIAFAYSPVISVIVPVYKTPELYLRKMIESVIGQSYENWELCIVDGSDRQSSIVKEYMEKESRINYLYVDRNLGISGNSNKALQMATGDYVTFVDHDDMLAPDALFCVVKELQEIRYDIVYSDEDKISADGRKYLEPIFKPDFSIDVLRAYNYINHLFAVKRNMAVGLGGFDSEFDGAQNYDFTLRCCERTTSIKHIPRVLYHKRVNNSSVSLDVHNKEYAKEAGKRALGAHIKRMGYYATAVHTDMWGVYKVEYETPGNPFLTIIIPGGNSPELLEKCIFPLFEKARYNNFEILVIDTESENKEMTAFYHRIESIRKNVKVITNTKLDGLPAIRNFGASLANGDYLFFLDNNVELIDVTAMGEMLGNCMREEVGAAAGVLYDDNDMIYNKGYVIGINGLVSNLYQGLVKDDMGYLMHNKINTDCSAVSASCMMVKKDLFFKVGGFSDKFKTTLSEIDFCFKLNELNRWVVSLADAGWHFHDTKPIIGNTIRIEEELEREEDLFRIMWPNILRDGDPFYNINFTKEGKQFTLPELTPADILDKEENEQKAEKDEAESDDKADGE
ncbi:MAG: glycosyltransferase [Lachnospiraceae bacterium]|nr:glycosyltransferase [Lachnospiraceae bacterium]